MLLELSRGEAGILLEYLGKIALVVKMQTGSDIRQRDPGQLDQTLGFFDPLLLDVVADGGSSFFLNSWDR